MQSKEIYAVCACVCETVQNRLLSCQAAHKGLLLGHPKNFDHELLVVIVGGPVRGKGR